MKNFYFADLSTLGQAVSPFTWTLAGGALPSGLTLFSNGQLFGTPTATGTLHVHGQSDRRKRAGGDAGVQPDDLAAAAAADQGPAGMPACSWSDHCSR